jgi:hypothetical protein
VTTFQIATDVLATELGSECVILNLADGVYYGLDDVGAEIWKQLSSPVSVFDICRHVADVYEVDPDQCNSDVVSLLDSLQSRGLIIARES